ncbi:MAG: radical SAM-associated putative lipoprotein [Prevotella sp.]|nr:radical SAM-associated putative lipoprotein [Prevotella sp.]
MKVKLTHWYNWMTGVLLSLLGFSSCNKNEIDDPGNNICLYGTPTTHYIIKGKVTDTDGKPINGVKVEANDTYDDRRRPLTDEPVYTDEKGEYSANAWGISSDGQGNILLEVTFEDVDGEANGGTFANDTVRGKDMTIEKVKDGDGAWNRGTYEITANKTMKKKQ